MPAIVPLPTLTVVPWPDAVIDQVGHDVRAPYVERFWLSVLGPTASWLVRRLALRLDTSPEGFQLDLAATAAELGLGATASPHSPFARTVQRCARFGLMQVVADDTLRVRRRLPPLTRAQVERLPDHLRDDHHRWTEAQARRGSRVPHEQREEARGLALSLLAQGVSPETAERGLHRRAVHPALAHEAVAWATSRTVTQSIPASDLPPEAA